MVLFSLFILLPVPIHHYTFVCVCVCVCVCERERERDLRMGIRWNEVVKFIRDKIFKQTSKVDIPYQEWSLQEKPRVQLLSDVNDIEDGQT